MRDSLLSFLTGGLLGATFAVVKLPVPAPQVFAGVTGVIGIWAGYALVAALKQRLGR